VTTRDPLPGLLQFWLQPSIAWLEAMQALQRAQMSMASLARKRLAAAQQVPPHHDIADALAIPMELAQFGAVTSMRLGQELADIGMHAAGEMNSRIADAMQAGRPA